MFGMLRKASGFSLSTCVCGTGRDVWRFVLIYLFTKSTVGWGGGTVCVSFASSSFGNLCEEGEEYSHGCAEGVAVGAERALLQ